MLVTIAVILLVLWILARYFIHVRGFIYVLLVAAIILFSSGSFMARIQLNKSNK